MKGIVFTELLELVEGRFGLDMVDRILADSRPASGGAYTAVGTYDAAELAGLVGSLSRATGATVPDLLEQFGEHLFSRFVLAYPQFFVEHRTAFDFLENTDGYIHMEVRKLYPDAELPRLVSQERSADRLVLIYESPRRLEDLAEGLLRGCSRHFEEPLEITRELLTGRQPGAVRFVLTRRRGGS